MAPLNAPANERRHIPERRLANGSLRSTGWSGLDWAAILLMIVGGINWGLVGIADVNLVTALFGADAPLTRAVYIVVGLAALYGVYLLSKMAARPR